MISPKLLKQISLLFVIVFIGYYLYQNVLFLADAILGALMLFIISRKPIIYLVKKGYKRRTAMWVFMIVSILIIVIPVLIVIFMIENNFNDIVQSVLVYKDSIQTLSQKIVERTGINVFTTDSIKTIGLKFTQWLPNILNSTVDIMTTIGILFFLLYYFLSDSRMMLNAVNSLIPLNQTNRQKLYELVYSSIMSNAIMVPLVALSQALIAWFSYIVAGVSNSFIWYFATFVACMIPIVGGALVYIPIAVVMFFNGHQVAGIFIFLWGAIVMSLSDNLLRIQLMRKFDDTHPLITFMGVIIGLNLFGVLGLIYGPLIISLFIILIKMYQAEYSSK